MDFSIYEDVKDLIRPVLLNAKTLVGLPVPWQKTLFPDLCLSLKLVKKDKSGDFIVIDRDVDEKMLEDWGVSFEQALEVGKENLARFSVYGSVWDATKELRETIKEPPEEYYMWTLRAEDGCYGTAACLNDGFFDYLYDTLGEFVIIPSSVHEFLFVRNDRMNPLELNALIEDVNSSLPPGHVLSDRAYIYDKETGTIS